MSDSTITLPNGSKLLVQASYSSKELHGVTFLVVVSCISLLAVVGLLVAISISAFNTRASEDRHLFVRTHVAAYFVSLLLCDFSQAIGSIFNAHWVALSRVELGDLCTTQGVFKQASDVGSALWTFVIALHTFFLLVLESKPNRFTLIASLIAGWSGIFAIVIAGPAALNTVERGPFFGISGYWCWISEGYPAERITLDYMFMFIAAFLSFLLYTLIFLRLRGNLVIDGWRMRFRKTVSADDRPPDKSNDKSMMIAKQMLLYPIAYSIIILPIAVSRFSAWTGHDVPFEATVFCETIFLLSGTVNVTLFCTTRRILPPQSLAIRSLSIRTLPISRPQLVEPELASTTFDPYYEPSIVHGYGYGENKKEEDYKRASGSTVADSATAVSVPYEHTVAPLQIRKDLSRVSRATRASRRPDHLPNLVVDNRMTMGGESVYDLYNPYEEDLEKGSPESYKDVNLNSADGYRSDDSHYSDKP